MWCLIRVSTVWKRFSPFSLGISKSHSQTYLKLKSDSSNIQCGGVYSVCNRLNPLLCISLKGGPENLFLNFRGKTLSEIELIFLSALSLLSFYTSTEESQIRHFFFQLKSIDIFVGPACRSLNFHPFICLSVKK